MNYHVLTDDLQRLSKVMTVEELEGGEGVSLVNFKTDFPVLFDCLYSIFGTMLSTSCLYEQVHVMMRDALREKNWNGAS